jgi:hypothetical protein
MTVGGMWEGVIAVNSSMKSTNREEKLKVEIRFQSISRVLALILLGLLGGWHRKMRTRNRRIKKKKSSREYRLYCYFLTMIKVEG